MIIQPENLATSTGTFNRRRFKVALALLEWSSPPFALLPRSSRRISHQPADRSRELLHRGTVCQIRGNTSYDINSGRYNRDLQVAASHAFGGGGGGVVHSTSAHHIERIILLLAELFLDGKRIFDLRFTHKEEIMK
ncbi:hypothetical protein J6590_083043 [Homalodisca vitripennis]|nr:hypothetical protein J6590_083043 [Homalodisca vitripennis]